MAGKKSPLPALYRDCSRCGWRTYPVQVTVDPRLVQHVKWAPAKRCASCGRRLS